MASKQFLGLEVVMFSKEIRAYLFKVLFLAARDHIYKISLSLFQDRELFFVAQLLLDLRSDSCFSD